MDIVIRELPGPLPARWHRFKVPSRLRRRRRVCRVRYDNVRGKGDHRHIGEDEQNYAFSSVEQLLDDFGTDVERWG